MKILKTIALTLFMLVIAVSLLADFMTITLYIEIMSVGVDTLNYGLTLMTLILVNGASAVTKIAVMTGLIWMIRGRNND